MQNSKSAKLTNKLVCTCYELTVGQVLSLAYLLADFDYPSQAEEFFTQHSDNLMHRARDVVVFNTGDFEKNITHYKAQIYALFVEANPALFSKSAPDTSDFGFVENTTGTEYVKDMTAMINALVKLGHSHVLTYPLSFYNTVIETLANGE